MIDKESQNHLRKKWKKGKKKKKEKSFYNICRKTLHFSSVCDFDITIYNCRNG